MKLTTFQPVLRLSNLEIQLSLPSPYSDHHLSVPPPHPPSQIPTPAQPTYVTQQATRAQHSACRSRICTTRAIEPSPHKHFHASQKAIKFLTLRSGVDANLGVCSVHCEISVGLTRRPQAAVREGLPSCLVMNRDTDRSSNGRYGFIMVLFAVYL